MGVPAAGSVVVIPFPFSDLSNAKRRPAVVLADAGKGETLMDPPFGTLKSPVFDRLRDAVIKVIRT
jgi:hypothetical protein